MQRGIASSFTLVACGLAIVFGASDGRSAAAQSLNDFIGEVLNEAKKLTRPTPSPAEVPARRKTVEQPVAPALVPNGPEMERLQKLLNILGESTDIPRTQPDGQFGPGTQRAITAYQRLANTPIVDGRPTWELYRQVEADAYAVPPAAWMQAAGAASASEPQQDQLTHDEVVELQQRLNGLGHDTGGADGTIGRRTREAVRAFEQSISWPQTGQPSRAVLQAVRERGVSGTVAAVPASPGPAMAPAGSTSTAMPDPATPFGTAPSLKPGRSLGQVGADFDLYELVLPEGGWCSDGVAEVILQQSLSSRASQAALAAAAQKKRQLIAEGLDDRAAERRLDRDREDNRNRAAREIAEQLRSLCDNLRVVRFVQTIDSTPVPFGFCARERTGWIWEGGRCDDISDRAFAEAGQGAGLLVLAEEAEARGWADVSASMQSAGFERLRNADIFGSAVGGLPEFNDANRKQEMWLRANDPDAPILGWQDAMGAIKERRYDFALQRIRSVLARADAENEDFSVMLRLAAATAHEALGQPAESLGLLREALTLAPNDDKVRPGFDRPAILSRIGSLYERAGRYDEADATYDQGLAEVQTAGTRADRSAGTERRFLVRKALLLERQAKASAGEREEMLYRAQDILEQALEAAQRETLGRRHEGVLPASPNPLETAATPDTPDMAPYVASSYARVALALGQEATVLERGRPALAMLVGNESLLGAETPFAAELRAVLAAAEGDPAALERAASHVAAVFGSEDPVMGFTLAEQSRALLRTGSISEALEAGRAATAIAVSRAALLTGDGSAAARAELEDARQSFDAYFGAAYEQAEAAPDRRDALVAETFVLAQQARRTAASGALAQTVARLGAGRDEAARLIRERREVGERWRVLDGEATTQTMLAGQADKGKRAAALRAEASGLAAKLNQLNAELRRTAPELAAIVDEAPVSLSQVQALLDEHEALLLFDIGSTEGHVWAVTAHEATWRKIGLTIDDLVMGVDHLLEGLRPETGQPPAVAFDLKAAYSLYTALLSDVEPALRDKDRLLIVPGGPLQSLPLAVLVTAPTAESGGPETYRDAAWLIRRHALATLPSVGSLEVRRLIAGGSEAPVPFLGLGDPVLKGKPESGRLGPPLVDLGGVADVEWVRRMSPLPDTGDELRAIAAAIGAPQTSVLLGDDATEARLKSMNRDGSLREQRLITFATHGLVANDTTVGPTEPSLVLTPPTKGSKEDDGLLTASEISELTLGAEWVILSACDTAGAERPGAEGLSGLARAFFQAGARSLLVSYWKVDSAAATRLTTGMFDALRDDPKLVRAGALRRSMLAFVEPGAEPRDAEPWRWAPFAFIGSGR